MRGVGVAVGSGVRVAALVGEGVTVGVGPRKATNVPARVAEGVNSSGRAEDGLHPDTHSVATHKMNKVLFMGALYFT